MVMLINLVSIIGMMKHYIIIIRQRKRSSDLRVAHRVRVSTLLLVAAMPSWSSSELLLCPNRPHSSFGRAFLLGWIDTVCGIGWDGTESRKRRRRTRNGKGKGKVKREKEWKASKGMLVPRFLPPLLLS